MRKTQIIRVPLHITEVSDLAGINVDKYLLDGGCSWIYYGFDENTKKELIVKVPFQESSGHNIENEINALEKLKHPSLVELISYGEGEAAKNREVKYLVEECVKGITLGELVRHFQKYNHTFKNSSSVKIMYQICDFLKHVHNNGLIYPDLKPDNIILLRDRKIKFIDLATVTKSPYFFGETITGTPGFISPDVTTGLTNQSDIYVAGIVFYTMLMGEIPFDSDELEKGTDKGINENMQAHMFEPRPRIQDKSPDVPNSVSAIAYKMMQSDKIKRYQSMEEVLSDLEKEM